MTGIKDYKNISYYILKWQDVYLPVCVDLLYIYLLFSVTFKEGLPSQDLCNVFWFLIVLAVLNINRQIYDKHSLIKLLIKIILYPFIFMVIFENVCKVELISPCFVWLIWRNGRRWPVSEIWVQVRFRIEIN